MPSFLKRNPRFTKRMECVAVDSVRKLPATDRWFRAIKWDGYRICVVRKGNKASIVTKANLAPSARYQHIEVALAHSELPDCVLDGELVALDAEERPVFQLLQQSRRNASLVVIYIFDVLNYAGRGLKRLPLQTRRATLDAMADEFPQHVLLSPLLPENIPIDRLVGLWMRTGLRVLLSSARILRISKANRREAGSSIASTR